MENKDNLQRIYLSSQIVDLERKSYTLIKTCINSVSIFITALLKLYLSARILENMSYMSNSIVGHVPLFTSQASVFAPIVTSQPSVEEPIILTLHFYDRTHVHFSFYTQSWAFCLFCIDTCF